MKIIKPLTVKQIENTKTNDKEIRLRDGNGLFISITPSSKIWRFDYVKPYTKKRTMLSIGHYPAVSLIDARAKRDEYLSLLAKNIDPKEHILQEQQAKQNDLANVLRVIAEEWLSKQDYARNTQINAQSQLGILYKYLADKPVSLITSFDVLDMCENIASTHSPLMANVVKSKLAQVLDYALAKRMITHNPARGLVRTHKSHTAKHHPAITESEKLVPLFRDVNNIKNPILRTLLLLSFYLFVRPSELVAMHINDIDFNENVWKYTPSKTRRKTNVQMMVPLTTQVIELIQSLRNLHGQDYIFPSFKRTGLHIYPNSGAAWLRDNGYQGIHTAHGFRATARTILEEELEYDPKYIEMQLGHQVKDINGTAYNRAKYLKQRKEMMQAWADYLDRLKQKKQLP